jgi:hypothetical protein
MNNQTVEYWNLVTGDRAEKSLPKRQYFELGVYREGDRYETHTFEGEFLGAYDSAPTFGQAWIEALTYTMVGGEAYQHYRNMQAQPRDIDSGTQPYSPVYDGPFDPYAGNLDELLGY